MSQEHVMQHLRRASAAVLCASALLLASTQAAQAQSEVSVGLSMLPVASVVGAASVAGAAIGRHRQRPPARRPARWSPSRWHWPSAARC